MNRGTKQARIIVVWDMVVSRNLCDVNALWSTGWTRDDIFISATDLALVLEKSMLGALYQVCFGTFGAQVLNYFAITNSVLSLKGRTEHERVTDRWRLGVLRPDTGLRDPDVSKSSVDDQEDKS